MKKQRETKDAGKIKGYICVRHVKGVVRRGRNEEKRKDGRMKRVDD